MRVLLVTPIGPPAPRGNAVTVARIQTGLRARGIRGEILDLSAVPPEGVAARLNEARPDLVHAFHALRAAVPVMPLARARGLPVVVTLTGTDVNEDLAEPARRSQVAAALREAAALVAFHETMRERLAALLPDLGARCHVIPQSVLLGSDPCPLAQVVPRRPGEIWFLQPAGIRRVKNVLFPLAPLRALARRYALRWLLVGPVIEPREGSRVQAALKGEDWAAYLGEVPHGQMGALYDRADVVVNSSLSEGGMANAVLEAMSRGKPVLASDIEGNRSVIRHGVDGLLFASEEAFRREAERLVRDPVLRARLGAAARARIAAFHTPDREADAHLALYRAVLGRG